MSICKTIFCLWFQGFSLHFCECRPFDPQDSSLQLLNHFHTTLLLLLLIVAYAQVLIMESVEANLVNPDNCLMLCIILLVLFQESVEATAEVAKTFDEKIRKYCDVTLMSLAYAGTGNVLKVHSQCYIISLLDCSSFKLCSNMCSQF
jgi:hypothetical protein